MSIGTQERPINIKDLILEEPERTRELPFDSERDVTKEEKKLMMQKLVEQHHTVFVDQHDRVLEETQSDSDYLDDEIHGWIYYAAILKIFAPREFPASLLDQRVQDFLTGRLVQLHKAKRWKAFLQLAAEARSLFPYQKMVDDPDQVAWDDIHNTLDTERHYWEWEGEANAFANQMRNVRIAFPNHALPPTFTPVAWGTLEDALRDAHRSVLEHSYVENFMLQAVTFRVYKRDISMYLDRSVWDILHQRLSRVRRQHLNDDRYWETLAHIVADMTILAAEEVKVTDHGLEITMRKPKQDFAPPTPPMPEVRRFLRDYRF